MGCDKIWPTLIRELSPLRSCTTPLASSGGVWVGKTWAISTRIAKVRRQQMRIMWPKDNHSIKHQILPPDWPQVDPIPWSRWNEGKCFEVTRSWIKVDIDSITDFATLTDQRLTSLEESTTCREAEAPNPFEFSRPIIWRAVKFTFLFRILPANLK